MKNEIKISETAQINGRGSDRYKSVTHLTKEEKQFISDGGTILIQDYEVTRPAIQCGWKQVISKGGKYYHREATPEQVNAIARN